MRFNFKDTALIQDTRLNATLNFLTPYINHLDTVAQTQNYDYLESSINLPFDESQLKEVLRLKDKMVGKNLKYIINIGIGGSNLGAKAIYDAIYGYADLLELERFPKIIFSDTSSPTHIYKLQKFLEKIENPEEIIVNVISKSGTTTETIANMEMLAGYVQDFNKRLVVTTDENSKLWEMAEEQNVERLTFPNIIGGRYSVFTAVGLFPLLAAGINIIDLLSGAMEARHNGTNKDLSINMAAMSASLVFNNYKKGKHIHDSFYFHPELESLGKWYRQLFSESLGKKYVGITPTVSIGSTDLHSVAQLYLGGARDKYFTFIKADQTDVNPELPTNLKLPTTVEEIKERSANEIMDAIYKGTKQAFFEKKLPYSEINLNKITPRELGYFMQFKMIEIMYVAKLVGVNAFDQPNVENYKTKTKNLLQ